MHDSSSTTSNPSLQRNSSRWLNQLLRTASQHHIKHSVLSRFIPEIYHIMLVDDDPEVETTCTTWIQAKKYPCKCVQNMS